MLLLCLPFGTLMDLVKQYQLVEAQFHCLENMARSKRSVLLLSDAGHGSILIFMFFCFGFEHLLKKVAFLVWHNKSRLDFLNDNATLHAHLVRIIKFLGSAIVATLIILENALMLQHIAILTHLYFLIKAVADLINSDLLMCQGWKC